MPASPDNPSLLIGVGAFGGQVIDRVPAADVAAPSFDSVRVLAGSSIDAVLGEVLAHARRLLDLGQLVTHSSPEDSRGPRLDVLVAADVGDEEIAPLVAPLLRRLATELRREFRSILAVGDGRLAICPLLLAPLASNAASVAIVLQDVAALQDGARGQNMLGAPIYVVQDQSRKYRLSHQELACSFASFVHVLLFSRLRDRDGVRDLVEQEPGRPPFATFACATLEVDVPLLRELCAHRLTADVLARYQRPPPGIDAIASAAAGLVPPVNVVEQGLVAGQNRSLLEHLQPPVIEVPAVAIGDGPEAIMTRFATMWKPRVRVQIDAYRGTVELHDLSAIARRIHGNGTRMCQEIEDAAVTKLSELAADGPDGPVFALEVAARAARDAERAAELARGAFEHPDLPRWTVPPLEEGLRELEMAVHRAPRSDPFRLEGFAVILGLLASVLAARGTWSLVRELGLEDRVPQWLTWLVGAALAAGALGYSAYRHRVTHFNSVKAARDALASKLNRYLRVDLQAYFERRVAYTQLMWRYRLYRGLGERLRDVASRLEHGQRAIARAASDSEARVSRKLEEEARDHPASALLLRSVVTRDLLEEVYGHAQLDADAICRHVHALATADVPVLSLPHADAERVHQRCLEELASVAGARPFDAGNTPLHQRVHAEARRFVAELMHKLSPPLELAPDHVQRGHRSTLIHPPASLHVIDEHADARGWARLESDDHLRVHLLLDHRELGADAVIAAIHEAGTGPEVPA